MSLSHFLTMGRCIEAVCNNGCSVTTVCQSCCNRKTFPLHIFRFMFPVSQQTLSFWFWNGWQVDQLKSPIPQIFWTHADKFARGSWAVRSCMGRPRTLWPWWCQEHSLSCSWISEEGDHLKSDKFFQDLCRWWVKALYSKVEEAKSYA